MRSSTTQEGKDQADEIEFEHENLWTCCSGGKIDKRGMIFIVQTFVVLLVLVFSMYMIGHSDADTDVTVWVSIVSAIVGNFLPTTSNSLTSNHNQ